MSESGLKLEFYNWKRISHGLFDYDNTSNCAVNTLKLRLKPYVVMRCKDDICTFESFHQACDFKTNEERRLGSDANSAFSFFAMVFKDKDGVKIYSYNQLSTILNFYGDEKDIKGLDSNLREIFRGCQSIKQARDQLDYLGCESFSQDLWRVAKTLDWKKSSRWSKIDAPGVALQEGDIVKMGRLKLKLRKIHLPSYQIDNMKAPNTLPIITKPAECEDEPIDHERDISVHISESNEEIPPCRFCLSNVMDEQDNPLINPCGCKGTQGLLHVECLKEWMQSKRSQRVFNIFSEMYTWKTVNCELCHQPYPFKIRFNHKEISLLEYDVPDKDYIAFETFMKEGCNKATIKSVYIFRVHIKDRFLIGRSHDVEFHIDDISVSRKHCETYVRDNKLYIVDNRSKFGTQILCKTSKPICRRDVTQNMYQIGRTWFMASYATSKASGGFCCLFGKKHPQDAEGSTQDQNADIEEQTFLDPNLVNKLENDIENYQKDRDSVFQLDQDFYDRLMSLYLNKEESKMSEPHETMGAENPTIDEYRRADSESSDQIETSRELSDDNSNSESYSAESEEDELSGISQEDSAIPKIVKLPTIERKKPDC